MPGTSSGVSIHRFHTDAVLAPHHLLSTNTTIQAPLYRSAEATWEGMTMTMWLLKDGWEDEWRFVDDVPDDGQEPVC